MLFWRSCLFIVEDRLSFGVKGFDSGDNRQNISQVLILPTSKYYLVQVL